MAQFTVNAEQLAEALIEDISIGLTPMVTSSPGMGKSDIVRKVAARGNLKVIDLRVSQCEPVDMQGYPGVILDRMTFHTPEYFPLEGDALPLHADGVTKYSGWLLFLDEFNSGNKQTEAAAYKLILDKAVYLHKLHPMCVIIAAGNLSTDRAIVNTQSTATTSRMTHYQLAISNQAWIDWANEHGIDHRIISFIKFKPDSLHNFKPNTDELTFPCPRTWAFASKIIKSKASIEELTTIRLAGTVGDAAAVELTQFSRIYQDLPTIESILANPASGWKLPTQPDRQYAITTLLAHSADENNLPKIITAIERLDLDFQVITFKDIYKKSPHLKDHAGIKNWISAQASNLF